ncbi:MAG: hypothetical protein ABR548_01640 [Actinomycetota bacterium]|nr:hypothetical protein [Actinomycetota bacterium]
MPKMSRESTTPDAQGPATEWRAELNGYTASIVKLDADGDLTELLKGLPGDHCPSPHWGYVFKGRMWFRDGDQEEAFGAGDAFYVNPGHTSGADEGTEFVVFSPTEIMSGVEAHMMQRAKELSA